MEPFDALTEEDKKIFLRYIEEFGGTIPTVPLSDLLRFWNENKSEIFKAFGGNLTLRKTVHYARTKSQVKEDFENIYFAYDTEAAKARNIISDALNDYAVKVFLDNKDKSFIMTIPREYYWLTSFASIYNLMENTYEGETFFIPTPEGKKFKIQKGCHILPTLRKLCRIIGVPEETYEVVRLAQSRALNDADITGTLCLSIAPIDYVSMSDNNCGWDSCMAWYDHEGEYRAGTIEMMNSPYVIVAYLDDATPFYPFGDKKTAISNKRWRQLIIANKNLIIGNRHYPFESPSLETEALNWVRELFSSIGYSYEDEFCYFKDSRIKNLDNGPRLSFSTNLMYNDIYDQRTMYLSRTFLKNFPTYYRCNFSGESECMHCGEEMPHDSDTSWVTCAECQGVKVCSNCGGYIYDSDDYEENSDGEIFCSECLSYSDSIYHCEYCNEPHYDNDLEYLEYIPINGYYSHSINVCRNCIPAKSVFGPRDEDGIYHAENFDDEASDFVLNCGNIIEEQY